MPGRLGTRILAPNPGIDSAFEMNRASHPKVTQARLLPRLRRICLRLPGASETASWGHPTFKAGGKTFCVLERYKGHLTLGFKLPAADAAAALSDARFFKSPYVGDKGWVSLIVERAPAWAEVAELSICQSVSSRGRLAAVTSRC
jgi:predicted DNA-binding protein (MmcQ/YjbR family)